MNNDGGLVSWKCKKQGVVALTTCGAKYMSITYAIQEANFLRSLYSDMTGNEKDSVVLYVDNQGAIALAENPVGYITNSKI